MKALPALLPVTSHTKNLQFYSTFVFTSLSIFVANISEIISSYFAQSSKSRKTSHSVKFRNKKKTLPFQSRIRSNELDV